MSLARPLGSSHCDRHARKHPMPGRQTYTILAAVDQSSTFWEAPDSNGNTEACSGLDALVGRAVRRTLCLAFAHISA